MSISLLVLVSRETRKVLTGCANFARVGVRAFVFDVVCVMLVFIARVVDQAVSTQFS